MKQTILHHSLADIKIKPIAGESATKLKQVIRVALNEYLEESTVPASVVHQMIKARYGEYYETPGYNLRVYRTREDLTQTKLAKRLGIHQHHLSAMEHNKRPIGKNMAKKLARILRCDYHEFL